MKDFSKKYLNFLTNDLAGLNLTRILDPDDFYNKQILDSINPAEKSELFKESLKNAKYIIDIGFGGGFPIIPLAKKFPHSNFIGFEAREKKVLAVKKIVDLFSLSNVKLFHKRVEDILFDDNVIIMFKAVGKIEKFLSLLNIQEGCKVFFYKGPGLYKEENLDVLGFKLLEVKEIIIEDTEKRYIVCFEKVLRGTIENKNKKTKKNLVKFSSLI